MRLIPALAVALGFATIAQAQTELSDSNNTCNASVIADMLHGEYQITAGPLAMTIGGMTMTPEGETTGNGTIYPGPLREFMVSMTPPIPDFRLEETDRLEPDWYWDAAPAGASSPNFHISSTDLELETACTIREMPRFVGNFQTMSQEGIPLEHTIRLVMALPDWMIGSWRFTAQTPNGTANGLRDVIFDRTVAHTGN